MASLYDNNNTMQILGCLIRNPMLLAEPKYKFNENVDFPEKLHKLVYGAIYNLFNSGVTSISPVDVDNYLSFYIANYEYYKSKNGFQFVSDAEELAQIDNFDYYYNKAKKFSALRTLRDLGYDVSSIYNEKEENPVVEEEMEKKLEDMEISDIFSHFKIKLEYVEKMFHTKNSDKAVMAHEDIEELLESFKNNPEVGVPFRNDIMNTIVKGQRKGKLYISSSGSGAGKALVNGTNVLMENGYTPIEKLKIGDKVYGEDGKLHKVLGIYPQGKKQVWEVEFSDGTVIKCCNEHLWNIQTASMRGNHSKHYLTLTLGEIYEKYPIYKNNQWNLYIPLTSPVQFDKKELPIDPYTLGALLGDGNSKSDTKFIPDNYKFSSVEDRIELLRGIIDTDGNVSYSSYDIILKSEKLIDDIKFIVESLGGTAKKSSKRTYKGKVKECGVAYRLHIKMNENIILCDSKKEQFNKGQTTARRTIRRITPTKNYEEMTCIYVDNPSHLFLTENCVVTHNTRSMAGEATYLAYPYVYNSVSGKWDKTGNNYPVLYITTEMEPNEIQTLIPAYLANVNEEHILTGKYDEGEWERIQIAIDIMKTYPNLHIEQMPNPNVSDIQSVIRYYANSKQVEYVFYDYIFSSTGLLSEYRDLKIREDVALLLLANGLKEVATENDVYIRTATQLNAAGTEQSPDNKVVVRNQNMIRGSKAVADKADVCYITMPISLNESKKIEGVCTTLGLPMPTHVSDIYKNRRGRYTAVRVWHYFDLGTCRMEDLFVTNVTLEPVDVPIIKYVFNEQTSQYTNEELMELLL